MCVSPEPGAHWPAGCAYFSSLGALGNLDMRISRVWRLLASWMCVFLGSGGYPQISLVYGKLWFCSAAREIRTSIRRLPTHRQHSFAYVFEKYDDYCDSVSPC